MTCNACGEKPKKTGREFTGPVIEINNPEQIVLLRKVVIPTSMGTEEQVPAAVGKYRNVILKYEANNHVYIYSSDGIPTLLEMDVPQEIWDSIEYLQQEIDDIKNNPDVVDIVDTYADLQAYDTSGLSDKDIIRVLTDETHDNESSYYRWNTATQTWAFIGATGPYYTKDEVDDLIDEGLESIDSSARVLSVDDYNWPEGNPDGVALWKLPYGAYRTPSDGGVKYYIATNDSGNSYRFFMIYPNTSSSPVGVNILSAAFITGGLVYNKGRITAVAVDGSKMSEGYIVTSDAIIDNLTTYGLGDQAALSAKQGYVLNQRIGDLSSLQTASNSSAVAAINAVNSNIGKAKVLSTADYNWNSTENSSTIEPFDCVALWLLDPGIYTVPNGVSGKIDRDTATTEKKLYMVGPQGLYGVLVGDFEPLGYTDHFDSSGSKIKAGSLRSVTRNLGQTTQKYELNSPIDGIGSLSTTHPLSAYQGTVLGSRIGNLSELSTITQASLVAAINEVNRENNYQSTEKNTERTWVDAKEIYKKTITYGALPNSTTKSSSHGIPVGDLDRIIDIEGFAYDSVNKVTIPIPDGGDLKISVTESDIVITTATDYSAYTECFITLYYTKNDSNQ